MDLSWPTVAEYLHDLSLPENQGLRDEALDKQLRDEALSERDNLDIIELAVVAAHAAILEECRKASMRLEQRIFLPTMDIHLGKDFKPTPSLGDFFETLLEDKLKKDGFEAQIHDATFIPNYSITGTAYTIRFLYAIHW